jgi:hypothetical protein
MSIKIYLYNEHRFGGDLHIVPYFEVTEKTECLCHANVAIRLESHISKRLPWVHVPNNQFCDHIQSDLLHRCLHSS